MELLKYNLTVLIFTIITLLPLILDLIYNDKKRNK